MFQKFPSFGFGRLSLLLLLLFVLEQVQLGQQLVVVL